MTPALDVVCIGEITLDITMRNIPENALSLDSSFADETIFAVGGDATNQAAVLSALGLKAGLVTKIGYDDTGLIIHRKLQEDGLDLTYLIRSPDKVSSLSIVVVNPGGQRHFLVWRGKNDQDLRLDEIDLTFLDRTRAVSAGSLFAMRELDRGGIAEIFRQARAKGVITFADMTADSYNIGGDAVSSVYPHTDYLIPSLVEATYVTGLTRPEEIARWFLDRGVGHVVIKLGDKGCFVADGKISQYVDPYQVEVVDTTGCGDNFTSGFIYGILHGMSLADSAQLGCGAGSCNAQFLGAHGGVKSMEQVQAFMANTPLAVIQR